MNSLKPLDPADEGCTPGPFSLKRSWLALAIQMAVAPLLHHPWDYGSERPHCSVHANTLGLGPRKNAWNGKDTSVRPAVQPDGGQKRKAGSSRSCMEVCETAINLQSGGSHRPSSSEREDRRRWELTGDWSNAAAAVAAAAQPCAGGRRGKAQPRPQGTR